jgi:hypothetical protein
MKAFFTKVCEALRLGLLARLCGELEAELTMTPRWRVIRRLRIKQQLWYAWRIAKADDARIKTIVAMMAAAQRARGETWTS